MCFPFFFVCVCFLGSLVLMFPLLLLDPNGGPPGFSQVSAWRQSAGVHGVPMTNQVYFLNQSLRPIRSVQCPVFVLNQGPACLGPWLGLDFMEAQPLRSYRTKSGTGSRRPSTFSQSDLRSRSKPVRLVCSARRRPRKSEASEVTLPLWGQTNAMHQFCCSEGCHFERWGGKVGRDR